MTPRKAKQTSNNLFFGVSACVFCALIFGFFPPAARVAYADGANITMVVLFTTFCRMVGLYGYTLVKKDKIFTHFNVYKPSIIAGLFQALSVIGILGGSYFMPGAVVIVIMFTYSLMLLLFNAWKGQIKLNLINVTATVMALVGLAFVLDIFSDGLKYAPAGIALALLAAVCTFARTYIYGKASQVRSAISVGAESFIIATIALLPMMLWEFPALAQSTWGMLMLLACAMALTIGSFGMFWGIATLGAYRFSMIMKLEPVFTTIFGIVLVGDILSGDQYLGIIIVLFSLIGLQIFDRQKT